jgi:tetratricopeptide (TPR) repeat protein
LSLETRLTGRRRAVAGAGVAAGLLSLVFALGCGRRAPSERPRPEDVPTPPRLESLEPPVKAQFEERRSAVLRLLAGPDVAEDQLADALGELGIAFHAYGYHAQAEACYARAFGLAPRSFRWAYALGLVRQERGDAPAADAAFRAALRLDPGNVPVRVRLAEVAVESGRTAEGESLYREALARDQDCVRAQVGLARIALERRRPAEAVDLLQRALAWHPNAVAIHQALGMAYRDLGKRDLAREHLRRVPPHKLDQAALPLADPVAAAVDAARVGARGHDLRATRALNEGRFDLAAIEFHQAVLSDPQRVYARHGLALALFRSGKLPEAAEALGELLQKAPSHAASRLLLARVLAAQGRLPAARQQLEGLLADSPNDAQALLQLAAVCLDEGKLEAAFTHYNRVIALAPELSAARAGAGLTQIRLGQRRRALQVLLGDGPMESLDPQAAVLAARLLAASPEPDLRDGKRALELARQAWEAEPTLSAAESMAMAEAEGGRFRLAVAWQREAASASGAGRPWAARRLALYENGRPVREPWAPGESLSHERVLPPDAEARGTP